MFMIFPTITELFQQVADTLRQHDLSTQPLHDLLSAFSQDVVQTRYPTFEALRDYCDRSANPVGRIMLGLFNKINHRMWSAVMRSAAHCK